MAQLKEILEKEEGRGTKTPANAIYLYAEGAFYHAYEWSAWLCCRYVKEFKVIRREAKNDEDDFTVFIGIPYGSTENYFPTDTWHVEQNGKDVVALMPESLLPADSDIEALNRDYANWKQSVPKPQPRKNGSLRDALKNTDNAPHRMSEIMLGILAFPVEQKTPMECMAFLTEVKQQIAKIL